MTYKWCGDDAARLLLGSDEGVLDVLENVDLLRFHCGKWDFAKTDLISVLGEELASRIENICVDTIQRAFTVRENLVNLKKVYLHLFHVTKKLERILSQFTQVFFLDGKDWIQYLERTEFVDGQLSCNSDEFIDDVLEKSNTRGVYIACSVGIQKCKGLLAAIEDARSVLKRICCVPRHPYSDRDPLLDNLCDKLLVCKLLDEFKAGYPDLAVEKPKQATAVGGKELAIEATENILNLIQTSLDLDDETILFIKKIFIARGISKALRIEIEAGLFLKTLDLTRQQAKDCLEASLIYFRELADRNDMDEKFGLNRHVVKIENSLCLCDELSTWVHRICSDNEPGLFVACDWQSSAALFLPAGFGAAKIPFQSLQNLIDKMQPFMADRLLETGMTDAMKGKNKCKKCETCFSRPWVNPSNDTCFTCEIKIRDSVKLLAGNSEDLMECPLKIRCSKACPKMNTLCPHSFKCFVCDSWSCASCKIFRCDGEESVAIINQLAPTVLFLDFDKTLVSTKNGQSPFDVGKKKTGMHSIDRDLLNAVMGHKKVHIVTRNSFQDHILKFLELHNLSHLQVHSIRHLPEIQHKSQVMEPFITQHDSAVFCDDSFQEILEPNLRELVKRTNLTCVLFARGY